MVFDCVHSPNLSAIQPAQSRESAMDSPRHLTIRCISRESWVEAHPIAITVHALHPIVTLGSVLSRHRNISI